MLSPVPNSTTIESHDAAWARLIPGDAPRFAGNTLRKIAPDTKKPTRSTRPIAHEELLTLSSTAPCRVFAKALAFLLPQPLLDQKAWARVRAIAADFTLVGLNWLLVGAMLVPLRQWFPRVRLFKFEAGSPGGFLGMALLHATLIALIGSTERLYDGPAGMPTAARVLVKSVFWATALIGVADVMQGAPLPMAGLIGCAGVLHLAVLLAWRQYVDHPRADLRNVLIVGDGDIACRVASHIETHPEQGRSVYALLAGDRIPGVRVAGRVSDLARIARKGFVDEVILAAPRNRDMAARILHEAQRLRLDVTIIPELLGCRPRANEVEHVGNLPLIRLHTEDLPTVRLVLKRWMDIAGAGAALVLLSPLMAVIAGLIKLDSRGPVIYRAQRAGRKGQLFRCYKFRTMVSDADERKTHLRKTNQRTGPFFKMECDPRITRAGGFLRRYSLDELPQFWNVLKGEMSLVGPRPHPVDDYARYNIEHLGRLDVTPGLTGLWQVMARRDPSFERGIDLDREYIRTWSLFGDMKILLQTIAAVLRGSGQ
jgi:exopolysaccharide biosynthesis polyprenyl glycosylphosphotransferase